MSDHRSDNQEWTIQKHMHYIEYTKHRTKTNKTKNITQKTKKMSNTDPTKTTTQKTKKMNTIDPTKYHNTEN